MTETGRFLRHGDGERIPSADLLRECGRKLTDAAHWQEFQERFQRRIFTCLMRILRIRNFEDDVISVTAELTQDVWVRMVQNNAHILRSFKGDTDFSVAAFIARVCESVASDFCRRQSAVRRQVGEVIPISTLDDTDDWHPEAREVDMNTILAWIDVERLVESDPEKRLAARNVLVFKLHYVDGFSNAEIAEFPGFNLTEQGVEKVLQRLRARLRKRMKR